MKNKKIKFLSTVFTAILIATGCGGRDLGNSTESGITGTGQATTAPTVGTISPTDNATGANRDVAIQVTFSVVVNTASVTMTTNTTCSGSIQVSTDSNFGAGTCIPMNQNVTQSGTQITVRTASLMAASTQHYVRITTAVAGSTGLTMVTQFNSTFTTGTSITPLTNEFGTDCTAGADTLAQAETGMTSTEANLGTARTISGLVVTGIDRFSSFYLQKGNDAIYVDVSTSGTACGGSGCAGNKASHYGLQVGDEICMTITRGQSNFSVPTVRDFSAIKKSGISSVTAYNVNVSGLPAAADISRSVTITGFISQKGTVGTNTDHYLTFNNTQIVIRDSSSTKFTNYNVGDYVTLNSVIGWFSGSPQIAIDSGVGSVSSAGTAPTYSVTGTVSGWTAGENFTITLNGANATVISANGAFSFTGNPTISGQYTVAVSVNPATYVCNLTNGTGYGLANVTNVSIACSPPPLYSMTSFASGDALTTASITVRCTPGNSTSAGQDIDSPLAGVPQGSYSGATNVSATSFGVLGLGADGFSVANTGTASTSCAGGAASGFINAVEIPVNTTGKTGITVRYKAAQYSDQTREWGWRLQYSLDGTTYTDLNPSGDFDSAKSGSVIYSTTTYSYGPFLLPAGADNNPNLKLRWRYHQLATTGGSRTRLILDDIYVADGGTTDSTAPTIGTLSLTGTGTDAALSWTAGSDNVNAAANLVYRVYRHTSSFTAPGTGTLVQTTLPGQTAFTNTGLTQGTTYFYRLLAVDSQGNVSGQSNEQSYLPVDTTPPTVSSANPTSGATGIAFSTSVSVTFSEAMTVAATQGAYTIKETNCTGTTVSTGSPAASGGNTIFTYALTNLKPSTVYAHCVTTAATDAASSPNALAADYSATWTTTALSEPTGVTATGSNTQVSIAFTVGNGNGGVKIVGQTGSSPADCTGAALYTGSTSPYVHTGLTNGTQYYYRVCSYHNSGAYLSAGVTATATPTDAFNVNSAASTGNTTATVTFSAAPVTSEAQTSGNYKIVAGAGVCADASVLTVSGAVLAGSVVTLTTAAQTASTSYKVCVTGVTRNGDLAALTTAEATFTGTGAGSVIPAGNSLALWTFETQVNTVTSTHANITSASSLLLNVDKNGGTSNWVAGCAPTAPNAYTDNTWNLATAALALADHYYEFTVTVQGGFSADLAALNFHYTRSGTGAQNYALYYSVDGYAAPIATGAMGTTGCTAASADLTALANISGTVTFRLTGYGATGATGTWRIDNVDLRN
jgi:hypothetical protein